MTLRPMQDDDQNERPPILGTWNRLYAFVLLLHLLLIAILYCITLWLS